MMNYVMSYWMGLLGVPQVIGFGVGCGDGRLNETERWLGSTETCCGIRWKW